MGNFYQMPVFRQALNIMRFIVDGERPIQPRKMDNSGQNGGGGACGRMFGPGELSYGVG